VLRGLRCLRLVGLALLATWFAFGKPQTGQAADAQIVERIVDAFAEAAIRQGEAVGVAVGIVSDSGARFSHSYTFGLADVAGEKPFANNSLFEIASNTKVFTTNLLGQAIFEKKLSLDDLQPDFSDA
jgi:CubicO group peptidase (beta-lactamase class C family)